MKKNKTVKLILSIILSLWLCGCQNETSTGPLSCENNIHVRCESNVMECKGGRNINSWPFQVTWFTKPERNREYFGAVFGGNTGVIWYPGEERDGSYCIDDKTIFFRSDKPNSETEKIIIIDINDIEMVLQFDDGAQHTYYNPESNDEISPELEELLKKTKSEIKKK